MNIAISQNDSLSDLSDKLEILFLDTFSSQNIEERSVDDVTQRQCSVGLVQFSTPVIIHELRIIPLSTLVSAESLKGVRLGATIPSSFEIHFYINDLKAKEAATFLDIGSFTYKEHDKFVFKPQIHVATDGLFLKGYFKSVTLAVLGIATDLTSLVNKELPSTSTISTNDIKDVQDSNAKESIDIKELDEFSDCDESTKNVPLVAANDTFNDNASNESEHFVVKEEVHSLSPSPEVQRIRSPSPLYHLSTPKSRSSTSSHERSNKNKELKLKSKYSSSRSNSISPSRYVNKNRWNISSPDHHRKHHSSVDKERDYVRSSSHLRDRYDDETYSNSRHSYKKSNEPSSHSRQYYNSKYEHDSINSSKDVHSKSHYSRVRSSERSSHSRSRDQRVSSDRNNDTRSVHSDTRDDNRSISSLNSRTRSSGGQYELSENNRDLSPKSSSSSKHHYSSNRSRRSRSVSRKRSYRYSHRDSYSPQNDSTDASIVSPDVKKTRYNVDESSPVTTSTHRYNNKNDRTACSRSTSPKVSSKVIECISSPASHNDELIIKEEHLSPIEMSPHSSISNVSLNSIDQNNEIDECSTQDDNNNQLSENVCQSDDKEVELFEPLSPSDNFSDLENDTVIKTEDNYEEISLSSDDDMGDDLNSTTDVKIENNDDQKSGELLEVISSDEEYDDELNAALSSDKIDYAKNYLEGTGSKYDDEEIDNCFDMSKNLFDPFVFNQLQSVQFPFNGNSSTTFIDKKLFHSIIEFVDNNFGNIYSKDSDSDRKELIDDVWVENVEQLAGDIMKLTSPIYCSFNKEDGFVNSEEELKQLVRTLVTITKDGLNFELAVSQKKIPFKVRHLKAGIKLLVALFSSFDCRFTEGNFKLVDILFEFDLPYDLLQLYNMPYMSLSMMLLVLNGLIVICDYPEGVQYVLTKKFHWNPLENQEGVELTETIDMPLTCYQYLLLLIVTQKKTRLTYVFEELLEKIHLYELFNILSNFSHETLKQACNDNEEMLNVRELLSEVATIFDRLSNRIHRPLRLLPNICQYEIKTAVHTSIPLLLLSSASFKSNPQTKIELFHYIKSRFSCKHTSCTSSKIGFVSQKAFYRYFKHFDLLKLFVNVLEALNEVIQSETYNLNTVGCLSDLVLTLLECFTSHQQGLKFLLEDQKNTDYANDIHKCLVKNQMNGGPVQKKLANFGVKFITRIYTFNLADKILWDIYQCQLENMDSSDSSLPLNFFKNGNPTVIDCLLKLFTMIYLDHSLFREWVICVLTMEHNFDAIISFILPITSQFDSTKPALIGEKISIFDSISFVYATNIASACIHYLPEKNLIHFYDSYGKSFLKNIENVQSLVQNSSLKLHKSDILQSHVIKFSSLINWLSPLKNGNLNSHDELTIRKFVTVLKKHHDACMDKFYSIDNYISRIFVIEPELITAIKILVSLCDPTSDYAKNQDPDIQLKYKYSLLHCYYYDGMSYLLILLDAASETCLRPSHQTYAYSSNDSYTNFFLKSFAKMNNSQSQTKQHSLKQNCNSILYQGSMILEFIRPSIRLLKLILNFLLESMGPLFSDPTPVPVLLKIYHFLESFQNISVGKNDRLKDLEISIQLLACSVQNEIINIILNIYTSVFVKHSEKENSLKKSVWSKMLGHVFDFISTSPKYFVCGLKILSRILPDTLPFRAKKALNEVEVSYLINYRKLWSARLHFYNNEIEEMLKFFPLSDSVQVQIHLRIVCCKLCDLYTPTVITISKSITDCLINNLNAALEIINTEKEICPPSFKRRYFQNCAKVLDLIFDLFTASIPFRIAILNSLYYVCNMDVTLNISSGLAQFLSKLYNFLLKNKFSKSVPFDNSFKIILLPKDDSFEEEKLDLTFLIEKYFQDINEKISSSEAFNISEKSISKFMTNCTKSLNEYFNQRTTFLSNCGDVNECTEMNDLQTIGDDSKDGQANNDVISKEKDNKIYSQEFVQLSLTMKSQIPDVWNFLNMIQSESIDQSKFNGEVTESKNIGGSINIDFIELSKKYFNTDYDGFNKVLNTLFSPIVEQLEPQEKTNEENIKMSLVPTTTTKRSNLRGRGRNMYGHRLNDPFRSRPPNTSRPPSMHVDDFVALEQRQDPSGITSLINKSRSNHLQLHINTLGHSTNISPYSKHTDYHRKKNLSSHHSSHSHSHLPMSSYSNYQNSLKSNLVNNQVNSLNPNISHYNK